ALMSRAQAHHRQGTAGAWLVVLLALLVLGRGGAAAAVKEANTIEFSHRRGFYEKAFTVGLTSSIANAPIYFTTNGAVPDERSGLRYSAPILITTTTILRAAVFRDGNWVARGTETFLFP